MFVSRRLMEWVLFASEHAPGIVPRDQRDFLCGGNVLFPFTGRDVPENGEYPERDQQPGRIAVDCDRGLKIKTAQISVDGKSGDQQHDDERCLTPVPKSLEACE